MAAAYRATAQMPVPPPIDITFEPTPIQKLEYYANIVLAFLMTPLGAVLMGALGLAYYYRTYLLEKLCSFRDWAVSLFSGAQKCPQQTVLVDANGKPINIRDETRLGMLDALQQTNQPDPAPGAPNGAGGAPRR